MSWGPLAAEGPPFLHLLKAFGGGVCIYFLQNHRPEPDATPLQMGQIWFLSPPAPASLTAQMRNVQKKPQQVPTGASKGGCLASGRSAATMRLMAERALVTAAHPVLPVPWEARVEMVTGSLHSVQNHLLHNLQIPASPLGHQYIFQSRPKEKTLPPPSRPRQRPGVHSAERDFGVL